MDDWNLYEQHIHFHDKCFLIDGGKDRMPVMFHPEFYKGEDIDLLRQKLIEDLKKYIVPVQCGENKYKDWLSISFEQMKKNINKRFGVDE